MAFFFRIGAIYHITYSQWKTNPDRIYIFVLFGNPVAGKIHALNLGARQLTTMDKARIVHTIVRLSKSPAASKFSGDVLYRIFLTYLKPQIAKCYRTYFHQYVTRASLINYGLNKKEDMSPEDLKVYNPQMYLEAKKDFLVRMINMYTMRGFEVTDLQNSLAKIQGRFPNQTAPSSAITPTPIPEPVYSTEPKEEEKETEDEIEEPEDEQENTEPSDNDELDDTGYK